MKNRGWFYLISLGLGVIGIFLEKMSPVPISADTMYCGVLIIVGTISIIGMLHIVVERLDTLGQKLTDLKNNSFKP